MTEDQNISLIWGIAALVLVGSALFSRRIGFKKIVRDALGWVAIFAVFIIAFSYKDQLLGVWDHVTGELLGNNDQKIAGTTLKIRQSTDGHFWVNSSVNGVQIRFLIDSGATTTAMNLVSAKQANVDISKNGFPVVLSTANGEVEAQRGSIQNLQVGSMIATDLPIVVSEAFGDSNVIGMNFLSNLESWRVEGNEMILEPPTRSDN